MEQLDYKNIHLAIIAIEKGAKLMKVPPQNMYMRLKKQGLIHNFLLPYYDELHTQSAEWLAETTVETLKNWEEAHLSALPPSKKWTKTISFICFPFSRA